MERKGISKPFTIKPIQWNNTQPMNQRTLKKEDQEKTKQNKTH